MDIALNKHLAAVALHPNPYSIRSNAEQLAPIAWHGDGLAVQSYTPLEAPRGLWISDSSP